MFSGYVDVALVGEGGLGRIFRATRQSTGGVVAIKELRDVAEGSLAWHRARRELDALLRLKGHPYVVSVEEIIEGPNGPCLVMEFASGGSLMDRLASGAMSAPEAVLTGQHVTQALGAAHRVGIIHRDVKPHNLLVGAFGQVKVCDFGIAAVIRGTEERTQTKALTLDYASPEELDGEETVGPPADVYSFAATMLHLITGSRPKFRDRATIATAEFAVPGGIEPVVRPILDAMRRSLANDPDLRPTMSELNDVFDTAALELGPRRLQDLTVAKPTGITNSFTDNAPTGPRSSPGELVDTVVRKSVQRAPIPGAVGVDGTVTPNTRFNNTRIVAGPAVIGGAEVAPAALRRGNRALLLLLGVLALAAAGGIGVALSRGSHNGASAVASPGSLTMGVAATTQGIATAPQTDPNLAPKNGASVTTVRAAPTPASVETSAVIQPASTVVEPSPPVAVESAPPEPVTVAPPATSAPLEGDLRLMVPITRPPCDGRYITMIGATVTPGLYEAQTSDLLNRFNGSSYLRTEATCSSLRGRTAAGNPIYSVYFGPFATAQEACNFRGFGPPDAYVKTLDNVTPSDVAVGC